MSRERRTSNRWCISTALSVVYVHFLLLFVSSNVGFSIYKIWFFYIPPVPSDSLYSYPSLSGGDYLNRRSKAAATLWTAFYGGAATPWFHSLARLSCPLGGCWIFCASYETQMKWINQSIKSNQIKSNSDCGDEESKRTLFNDFNTCAHLRLGDSWRTGGFERV
jgi:hypothetical protein